MARQLEFDPNKVNPNGSGISLGHPVGATGAIITTKAVHELRRIGGRYAMVTMCIGGGQGVAAVFERCRRHQLHAYLRAHRSRRLPRVRRLRIPAHAVPGTDGSLASRFLADREQRTVSVPPILGRTLAVLPKLIAFPDHVAGDGKNPRGEDARSCISRV